MNSNKRITGGRHAGRMVWAGALGLAMALAPGGAIGAPEKGAVELTLGECVGLALENNLGLKIERVDRRMADLETDAARGGYDPELALTARRAHEETAGESAGTAEGALAVLGSDTDADTWKASIGGATGLWGSSYEVGGQLGRSKGERGGNPFDTSSGSAGITLRQPLLKGFRSDGARYRVRLAEGQSAEAAAQLEEKAQATLAEVEAAWYSLVQAREAVRVQEEAVGLATRLYEDNARKVEIGTMSALDEKHAASQAASARADLSSARRGAAEAQTRLKGLVFGDQRNQLGVELAAAGELTAERRETEAAASGERALERRPGLRRARLALERQGLTAAYQRDQTLPALDLTAGAGWAASAEDGYGDAADRIGSMDEPYWSAGVAMTIPLGNRTARAKYRQSLAAEERARLQLRQAEEAALEEAYNAAEAVATGWEKVLARREAREYAEQALEAEQRKLDSGKSTSFVVLQLQRDLTSARNGEIAALADYNRQLSALALAEGTILERLGVELGAQP